MANENKKVAVAIGADVHLVLANGKHAPAKVTKVGKGGLIDLEAELVEETIVITSSPFDETGKRADSWHLPEATETPKA
jgi:hypothetical protein